MTDIVRWERQQLKAKRRKALDKRLKDGTATTKEFVAEIRRLLNLKITIREATAGREIL